MSELRGTDKTMWDVPWELEPPSRGGRILAKDARSTVIYEPNCSPYSENEQKVARLFLKSREMLALLKRAADIIEDNNPNSPTVSEIDDLVHEIEGK